MSGKRKKLPAAKPSTPSHFVVEVNGLTVERNGTGILQGVDWRVRTRQNWVILGPNGSGKTSLLKSLTGYLMPTEGDMKVLGEHYGESDWRELRKLIGLVSSSISQKIPGEESALETVVSGKNAMIELWGRITRKDRTAAMAWLEKVECPHLADRPWRVLSQGERQRVLIARALMAGPALLILDEPCAGLDPVARETFLRFLSRLAKSKEAPTLVLVTHHVEEIGPAFSHVLLLKEGMVLAAGPRKKTLTSSLLSATFGSSLALEKKGGRYHLRVKGTSSSVV
ncbi:MAG: ABC transporter ATP-binding protein [Verrucomicrobiales bacterium]